MIGITVGKEEKVIIVKTFATAKPDSIVLTVPKELRVKHNIGKGQHFKITVDKEGKIIYTPVK